MFFWITALGVISIVVVIGWHLWTPVPERISKHCKHSYYLYSKPPAIWSLYLRMIFSRYNFTKSRHALAKDNISKITIECIDATPPHSQFKMYLSECGFRSQTVPVPFHLACSLSLLAEVVTSRDFPVAPLSPLVFTKQSFTQHAAIYPSQQVSKRVVFERFESKLNGIHVQVRIDLFSETALLATSQAILLLPNGKKLLKDQQQHVHPSNLNDWVHLETFPVRGDQGRRFAPCIQDYSPWHLYPILARMFGFADVIAHGFWSFSKSLALLENHVPDSCSNKTINVQWEKPIRLPAKLSLYYHHASRRFALWSYEGQHCHLKGQISEN